MIHRLRYQTHGPILPGGFRDGGMMVRAWGSCWHMGGWNSDLNPVMSSQVWKSTDDGKTWFYDHTAPWSGRHTAGYCYDPVTDRVYVWGWEWVTSKMDFWQYHPSIGWLKLADDWNITDKPGLVHFFRMFYDGYAYVALGKYDNWSKFNNAIYRTKVSQRPIQWEKYCDITRTDMQDLESGIMLVFKNIMYITGGGIIFPDGDNHKIIMNTKVFKHDWQTKEFTAIADTPLLNSFAWGDGLANDQAVCLVSGSDYNNDQAANNRILISNDMINFTPLPIHAAQRHATPGTVLENKDFIFALGNGQNDCFRITQIF